MPHARRGGARKAAAPWWVVPDALLGRVYTVDERMEDLVVRRVCMMDRYSVRVVPTARPGVSCCVLDPPAAKLAAPEHDARELAAVLVHNGVHGTLREAGALTGEPF